jgi:hypothetical protein
VSQTAFNLCNFTAYQLAWFAVIIGVAEGFAWLGAAVAVLVAAVHVALRRDALELKLIGASVVIGMLVDSTLAITGQVRFAAVARSHTLRAASSVRSPSSPCSGPLP